MQRKKRFIVFYCLIIAIGILATFSAYAQKEPIVIQEQGSFAVGGTVVTEPGTFDPIKHGAFNPANQSSAGQTLHGDHAYVFYQIPAEPRELPLVFWHGFGQFSRTWETTPDGREGFRGCTARRALHPPARTRRA